MFSPCSFFFASLFSLASFLFSSRISYSACINCKLVRIIFLIVFFKNVCNFFNKKIIFSSRFLIKLFVNGLLQLFCAIQFNKFEIIGALKQLNNVGFNWMVSRQAIIHSSRRFQNEYQNEENKITAGKPSKVKELQLLLRQQM